MFYPARMNSVIIGIHRRWLTDITSSLHEQGELEVLDLKRASVEDIPSSPPEVPKEDIEKIINLQFRADRVCEILQSYDLKPDTSLKSLLTPSDKVFVPARTEPLNDVIHSAEDLLASAETALEVYENLKKNRELQQVTLDRISYLNRLSVLDVDVSYLATGLFTFSVAGWIKKESIDLFQAWQNETKNDEIYLTQEPDDQDVVVFCIGTPEMKGILEELSHKSWFHRIILPESYSGLPSEILMQEQDQLERYQVGEQELLESLASHAKQYLVPLRAIREELGIRRERLEITRNFGSSRDVVYLHGWVRVKDTDRLSSLLKKITDSEFFLHIRPAGPEDDVPVRYDNPKWLAPFELLTTTFSRPRYDEIDPTPFFAPAYLLFFGLMLGDAGYGVIIALVGWLLYRGPGKYDAPFRDMSYILLCSGIADIILGTIQGGWFGDMLPRFFHITPPFVLIEPLQSPILLFQVALIIGTIHINLGILLGLWQNIRAKMYRTAFQEQGIWFILQPSAAVLLIVFFGWMTFSPLTVNLALAGAVFGLAVLFIKKGPMGFFSLTGFLGDWLSYVRILALALATGGIAMTINILSEMIASVHPFMIIPAILFCIAGQIFNLAIQTLGSVIHALRLHYIEFFGKFYAGGGKEFVPFEENRIYTRNMREEVL